MDIFQIGHKVKILERCLPTSNLVANNCFLIIGMHGRTVQVSGHRGILSEKRFNNFIVLMPFGCGWPLSDLSP
ncbi:MAG TPA: hypothetical protein VM577_00690, partial [Anaerovoracaceae bacterium]|nr:hypothetical protein [Anaerovoracaceae bacterium]